MTRELLEQTLRELRQLRATYQTKADQCENAITGLEAIRADVEETPRRGRPRKS